jgi:hypothetical protein
MSSFGSVSDLEIDHRVKLAYDESIRGLNMQSTAVDELRSRTGVLIAAATVASAFLGSAALEGHATSYWANILGLLTFIVVIGLSLGVLWPSETWEFVYDPEVLDRDYYVGDVDVTEMCRAMSLGNSASHRQNQSKLNGRFRLFRFASVALLIGVLLWLTGIGLR